jgi:hypothetical protein
MTDDNIKNLNAQFPKGHWILDENHNAVEVGLGDWAQWVESMGANRVVRQEHMQSFFVSTMFLGLDHRFGPGSPILFETMVFAKTPTGVVDYSGLYMDRYETYAQALEGHERAIEKIKRGEIKPEVTYEN